MKHLIILSFLFFTSLFGYGQDYAAFQVWSGYFLNKGRLDSCSIDLELKRNKTNKALNYKKAYAFNGIDLIYIHVTGAKSHNPITPCRMIADSTSKYGFYFVTLEELNKNRKPYNSKYTWVPPLNNSELIIFRKECFDKIVLDFLKEEK